MGTTLHAIFQTRREAGMTVGRFVQEHELNGAATAAVDIGDEARVAKARVAFGGSDAADVSEV